MKYTNLKDIMLKIEHIMLDSDIRQKDISNKTGWSRQTVSNLLACRRDSINIDTLNSLCDAIGCDLIIDIRKKDSQNVQKAYIDVLKRQCVDIGKLCFHVCMRLIRRYNSMSVCQTQEGKGRDRQSNSVYYLRQIQYTFLIMYVR